MDWDAIRPWLVVGSSGAGFLFILAWGWSLRRNYTPSDPTIDDVWHGPDTTTGSALLRHMEPDAVRDDAA